MSLSMNFSRILSSCGSLSTRRTVMSHNTSLLLNCSTNKLIPRRLLINSAETGALRPYKRNQRIHPRYKLLAAIGLIANTALLYFLFKKEEEINKFLGTEWNTSLVGVAWYSPTTYAMGYCLLAATFPW